MQLAGGEHFSQRLRMLLLIWCAPRPALPPPPRQHPCQVVFEDGSYVIRQGEEGRDFFVITAGEVSCTVKKNLANPEEQAKEVGAGRRGRGAWGGAGQGGVGRGRTGVSRQWRRRSWKERRVRHGAATMTGGDRPLRGGAAPAPAHA